MTASGTEYFLFGNGFTDGSETELKVLDLAGVAQSVGNFLAGKMLEEIELQVSDGSILSTCILYDELGAKKFSTIGNERTTWASNLLIKGIRVPIKKKMVLKVNTGD